MLLSNFTLTQLRLIKFTFLNSLDPFSKKTFNKMFFYLKGAYKSFKIDLNNYYKAKKYIFLVEDDILKMRSVILFFEKYNILNSDSIDNKLKYKYDNTGRENS